VNMEADGKEKESVSLKKLQAVDLLKQELQKKLESEGALEKALEEKNREYLELKQALETTNSEFKQTLEQKNREFLELKQTLEKTNSEFKQTLEQKNGECEKVKQALEQKNVNCTELKHQLEEVQKRLEAETNLEKSLEQKNRECQELKHKMEELESTLETLKTSNDEMIRNLETELCTPSSVDTGLEQELNQLRLKLKEMEDTSEQGKRDLLSNHQKEMDLEKTNHQKELEEEKTKHSQFIKQIENTLKSKENEIVRTLEEKDQTIYKLKNKLQSAYEKFNADKTKLEASVKNETGKLEGKLNALTEDNAKLKQWEQSPMDLEKTNHQKELEEEKTKHSQFIKQIENTLKSKENEIVRTLEEKDQTIYKLKNKLQSAYEKFNADKTKLEASVKNETGRLEGKLNALTEDNAKLKQASEMLESSVQEKDNTVKDLTQQMDLINVQVKELNENLVEKEHAVKSLQETIEKVEKEKSALEKKQVNIEQLESEKINLGDKVKQLEEEVELMSTKQVQYNVLLDRCKQLEAKETELTKTVEELRSVKEMGSSEMTKLKTKMLETFEENKRLKDQIKSLEQQGAEYLKEIESEELRSVKEIGSSEMTKLKTKMLETFEENKRLKDQIKSLEQQGAEYLKEIELHNQKIVKLEADITKLETNVFGCQDEFKEASENLQKELETKATRVTTLEQQLEEVNVELKRVEDIIKDKNEQEIILTNKQTELLTELKNLQITIETKSEENNPRSSKENQDGLIDVLKKEFDGKLKEETDKFKQMQQELDTKLDTETKLMKELENMKTISLEQESKIRNIVTTELEQTHKEKVGDLKHLIAKLEEDMEHGKRDIKKQVEEKEKLKKTIELQEQEISSLQNHKKEIEASNSQVNERLAKLSIENEDLIKEKTLLQEKHTQLSTELSTLRENRSKSKEVLEKMNLMTKENSELLSEKEQLTKVLSTLQEEMKETSSSHERQVNELHNELTRLKALNEELNSKSKEALEKTNLLTKKTGELTTEKERLNQLVATLQNEIEDNKSKQIQNNTLQNELQEELTKVKALNAELSSKSNEAIEKINILTQQNSDLVGEKQLLSQSLTSLQNELDSSKLQEKDQGSGQLAELQNELSKYKSANTEMKSFTEKYRVGCEKLANYLKIPARRSNNEIDLDMELVIDKFKALQTQMKTKERNETDFFMLTLEEELKKERDMSKNLEKELRMEKEKQVKLSEASRCQENMNVGNVKQLQTCCSQVKNELRQLRAYSVEQLDDITKEFIAMKMNLIQGVIKMSYMNSSLAQTVTHGTDVTSLKQTLEEEHAKKIKQLISEFKQEMSHKDEEIQALENKQFDRRDAEEFYISNELKRSIMNLEEENQSLTNSLEDLQLQIKQMKSDHSSEVNKLVSRHNEELKQLEVKWKEWMRLKLNDTEEKMKEECEALSQEWQVERKMIPEVAVAPPENNTEDLEKRLTEDDSVHKELARMTLELTQVKRQHKEEVKELRRLLNLGKPGEESASDVEGETDKNKEDKLGSCLELEYLRNVLFEYMMGKEPMVSWNCQK
ncbi:golgin subfamily A member 4-like, partial [Diaphorina citri]|uniref:Golgin subfamily A member 4-like n=1 Tax=Diaphorina citri TaxID=121845 RepID=A0A3Q0JE54_DIACI